jgi:hypothetical protein
LCSIFLALAKTCVQILNFRVSSHSCTLSHPLLTHSLSRFALSSLALSSFRSILTSFRLPAPDGWSTGRRMLLATSCTLVMIWNENSPEDFFFVEDLFWSIHHAGDAGEPRGAARGDSRMWQRRAGVRPGRARREGPCSRRSSKRRWRRPATDPSPRSARRSSRLN